MTVRADVAEIAHVLIVFQVTGDALGFGRVESRVFGMTVQTLDIPMAIAQGKAREVVVEGLFYQPKDVGIATFVIGMTTGAFTIANVRRQGMKSGQQLNVRGDFGMAIQTQVSLRIPGEAHMTGRALSLVLGVPGNHRPWHDQALEYLKLSASRHADPA
jgi:hypothetical protein